MRQQTAEVNPGHAQPALAPSPRRAKAHALRRFVTGFTVIIALLGVDALVDLFGASSVRASLAAFTRQQARSAALMADLQRAQFALVPIEGRLSVISGPGELAALKQSLAEADLQFHRLFTRIPSDDPDSPIWRELQTASAALTSALARTLDLPASRVSDTAALLQRREDLSFATEKLIQSIHTRTETTQRQIADATWRQSIEECVLLVGCLLVASLFLLTGTRIYYRMNEQSEELNRVSWQLLERQELLAQRLSRELHDELGQSLTALKTNFSRHAGSACVDPSWMQDCTELLKGSIRSAHEISQLLRPTLLDDFGLDSALSWLCERFEERNRIQVCYRSDFHWRLDEQAETHVFRIAQEALTNIARHSEATAVDVVFSKHEGIVRLKISDNGVGLKPHRKGALPSFGLISMRARARSLEGEMRLQSSPGKGVAIEILFPAKPAA